MAIRPGGRGLILHTLFYGDEIRVQDEAVADLGLVDEKALDRAKNADRCAEGNIRPREAEGQIQQRVRELVEKKRTVPGSAAATAQPRRAPVVDIMDALRQSLERVRKPAKSEAGERQPRNREKRKAK